MTPKLIHLLLNLGLLFAILVGPSVFMVSMWYRKNQGKPVFYWPKSEMVLITISFFVLSLVLFIVGISCFFTYFGYLDPGGMAGYASTQFLNAGLACMFFIIGMSLVYMALRKLLVQMVMENGLLLNKGILPVPNSLFVLEWKQIVDYYVVPDYPNVSFTFIVSGDDLKFERKAIKVPIYLKEDFQAFLDKKIYSSSSAQGSGSEISSSRFFSEN